MEYLHVDGTGVVDALGLQQLQTLLTVRFAGKTGLISVAYVNNEIGVVQDLSAIGRVIATVDPEHRRICFHTDAVQAPGHVTVGMAHNEPLESVDALSMSAHKFHGPIGIGMLILRSQHWITRPIVLGGDQQGGLRAGTESTGAALAAAAALQDATEPSRLEGRVGLYRSMATAVWEALLPFVCAGVVLPIRPLRRRRSVFNRALSGEWPSCSTPRQHMHKRDASPPRVGRQVLAFSPDTGTSWPPWNASAAS